MILTYAGIDLSGFVTKYGFSESVREIEGKNGGLSISGLDIPDVVAVKFDPSFVLRPMIPSQLTVIWGLVRAMPSNTYRTLVYTNPEGSSRTIQAKLVAAAPAEKVLETSSRTLFDGVRITFKEK